MAELTRKQFYDLAHECRDYALRLANYDQDSVDRALCKVWNAFCRACERTTRCGRGWLSFNPRRVITRAIVLVSTLLAYFFIVLVVVRLIPRWRPHFC